MEKILDLTMLSDIFPTGFHGCVTRRRRVGSTVYIAGAGPVGLAAAASAQLLGAAAVIVGDLNTDRLKQAASFGCETVDVSKGDPKDQIEQILGVPEVDCGVDAVGFEARGHGSDAETEHPATVLNSMMDVTRAGGSLGIPGLYVTGDPGAADDAAKEGSLSIRIGLGWAKSHSFTTGQCPVMKYHRGLMMAILHDRVQIAKAVNATPISIDDAPRGYEEFDAGASKKYVLDPNGAIGTPPDAPSCQKLIPLSTRTRFLTTQSEHGAAEDDAGRVRQHARGRRPGRFRRPRSRPGRPRPSRLGTPSQERASQDAAAKASRLGMPYAASSWTSAAISPCGSTPPASVPAYRCTPASYAAMIVSRRRLNRSRMCAAYVGNLASPASA